MSTNGKKKQHGGPRPNSGRPRKLNPEDFIQVTCVLRKDTVEKLRAGAGGKQKFFGSFLQFHLDRFPLPTHEEYVAMREGKQFMSSLGPRRSKTPVVFAGNVGRARRRAAGGADHKPTDAVREKFLKEFKPV